MPTSVLPASELIATALDRYAKAATASVPGILDGDDPEFLHGFRVALRRSRSLLKLTGDVLPFETQDVAAELKRLGTVSTPTRDLDVYLLDLPKLGALLQAGVPQDLEPFRVHLESVRERAHATLTKELSGEAFTAFFADWRARLAEVGTPETRTSQHNRTGTGISATALAHERISAAYRRVVKRARAITPESEAESVHDLRKRCKELRYLLEVFAPVCVPSAHASTVRDLKALQDILGDFQDGELQSHGLRVFAEEMQAAGNAPATALLALGELSAVFAHRQHDARNALTGQLGIYLSDRARRHVKTLIAR